MAVMYTQLAENAAVSSSSVPLVSQAVSMTGANAVQPTVVVANISGGVTLTLGVQGSNDLENWTTIGTDQSSIGLGYTAVDPKTSVAWQYVRLTYKLSGAGAIILSAGLSTAAL